MTIKEKIEAIKELASQILVVRGLSIRDTLRTAVILELADNMQRIVDEDVTPEAPTPTEAPAPPKWTGLYYPPGVRAASVDPLAKLEPEAPNKKCADAAVDNTILAGVYEPPVEVSSTLPTEKEDHTRACYFRSGKRVFTDVIK